MRAPWPLALVVLLACSEEKAPAPASQADTAASSAQVPAPTPPTAAATAETRGPIPAPGGAPKNDEGGEGEAARDAFGGGSKGGTKATKLAAIAELSEGTLDRSEVERAIDASMGRFTPCLQTEARVRVRATVSRTGDVVDAAVIAADPDEPKLRDCVAAVFRKVSFPKPKGADATTFTVDLALRPELKL